MLATRRGKIFQHISLTIAPRCRAHRELLVVASLPQAQPIVMFHRNQHQLHARRFGHPTPLIGIQRIAGIEQLRIFLATPPFFPREGIDANVDKTSKVEREKS